MTITFAPKFNSSKMLVASALASGLLATTSIPTLAFDAGDALTNYEALMEKSGARLVYESRQISGDSITLKNAVLSFQSAEAEIPFGDISISGIREGEDGKILVDTFSSTGINFMQDDVAIKSGVITMSDFTLPSAEDFTASQYQNTGTFMMDGLSVSGKGQEFLTIKSLSGDVSGQFPTEAKTQNFKFDDVALDMSKLPDGDKAAQTMAALGYQQLNFDWNIVGSWDPSGLVTLDEFDIVGDDIGALSLDMKISGYTEDVAKAIAEIQQKMAGATANQAGLQLMGEMQKLSLISGQLKFSDNSITDKLLNFFAPQMGTDANGLKAQAKGMLPLFLGQLGDPELTTMVSGAVSTYLDDPKSLQIDLVPAAPVNFGEIMGAGMAAPQTLPKVLGAKVSANQ